MREETEVKIGQVSTWIVDTRLVPFTDEEGFAVGLGRRDQVLHKAWPLCPQTRPARTTKAGTTPLSTRGVRSRLVERVSVTSRVLAAGRVDYAEIPNGWWTLGAPIISGGCVNDIS